MSKAYFSEFSENLFQPDQFTGLVDLDGNDKESLSSLLRSMLLIRYSEEKIAENVVNGKIKCPCHLGIGQEAIAAGISKHLKKSDSVFGAHRSHSHFLALNNDAYSLFAETLGKVDGCSNGLGGSMHLIDIPNGFYGSVPIVGATIPIATGAGFAHLMDGKKSISVSYFGDGAVEEGVFHESLNLAIVNKLPVLYVCENNLFASHMHILERQPELSTLRYAKSHNIKSLIVDGNDVIAVSNAAKEAIEHIREGKGPFFLECITYRWKGHVGASDDNDVGLQRSEVLSEWKMRDPIQRIVDSMISKKILSKDQIDVFQNELKDHINAEWKRAELSKYPSEYYLSSTVYSN